MRFSSFAQVLGIAVLLASSAAAQEKPAFDPKKAMSQEKFYVGSEVCRNCHLEHYDAWRGTLHSRMLVDAVANKDAIITEIDPAKIRADFEKIKNKLKVAPDKVHIPKVEDVKFTIGSQWKQRYLVWHDGDYRIAPTQFNIDTGTWTNYHEADWDKRSWLDGCGGCHATGVDLQKRTFVEPGVGCEACHGPGSQHAALPKSAVFEKRQTIVNPGKLTGGVAVQICGSCHNRGKSTKAKGVSWAVGYTPGKALETYFKSVDFSTDKKHVYANEMSKGHHQQYIDWKQSRHADEGVMCQTCHNAHKLGGKAMRGQTDEIGSKMCLGCHVETNKTAAHTIHSFATCVGCHMPKIANSAEGHDIRSHVFTVLLPSDTLADPTIPNSCQTCHKHKNEDTADLQKRFEMLTARRLPDGSMLPAPKLKEAKPATAQ